MSDSDAVTWLAERSASAVRDALATVYPAAATGHLRLHEAWVDTGNPLWSRSSAFLDHRFVVKFAWSEPAAHKLIRETATIRALGAAPDRPPVAQVVASSNTPVLLITDFEPGDPLAWETAWALEPAAKARIADELARVLTQLHSPATLATEAVEGLSLPAPTPQADTDALRRRLAPLLDPARADLLVRWCDWADDVLAPPLAPVFLHGDFHGHNLVFGPDQQVRRVLDLEEASIGDHHYDLRYLPAQEPTVELLQLTAAAYSARSGREVDMARVMAWHVRTACGDALWRTEARIPLPGGGTPSQWIDEIQQRFDSLDVSVPHR